MAVNKLITKLNLARLMVAQIARTAGAVAAGIDGDAVVLKCDEAGALLITPAPGASTTTIPQRVAFSSSNGNVGAVSAEIVAANASRNYLTVQNTHATQTLYISWTNPATAADIALLPGASMTFQGTTEPNNALYGLGSGAATTFAIMEG